MKNLRSSQPCFSMNFCTESVKHKFVHVSIIKPRFSGPLCLYICRSNPHFILRYSMLEKSINYLISTHIWSLPNQNKSFISIQTSSYFFKHFTLLITSFIYNRCCFGSIFFQKSKDSKYCQNLQKQSSAGAQKAFK